MLQELLKRKQSVIDKRAEHDKSAVAYLANLVEQNWNEFNSVFNPNASVPETQLPETIYSSVERIIAELNDEYCRPFGAIIYHGKEPVVPAVQLGWAILLPLISEQRVLHPTDKGKAVINGYRAAKGYVSLEEQAKFNKERAGLAKAV